ncbi:hypothetical protein KZZ52_10830 [Dactylosporangium sp. AC04546]|uniref:hypothetical protein n=1 Tax=Dactylosporangium sp. AC04546 TaxID=2862460 RepID=UPI001EDD473E|nr:hypothetical protein [Dactylosporangium sp. AC04546]WVK85851.1 hypothetical protein KZZ52_10830 [Dactylosporangium sp. AC04546]
MRLLTEAEYRATMEPEPIQIGPEDQPPFDFWPYFDEVPEEDLEGHDFSEGSVTYAWHMPRSNRQHVLVNCETPNVFLVLVLDLSTESVLGHYLLDIYGVA